MLRRKEEHPGPVRRALRKWYPLIPETMEELIETLQRLKEEEEKAHKEYLEVANAAKKIGYGGTATMLESIASDEAKHARLLKDEISVIR